MLMEPTELLDGVEPTLRALSERYDMLLITKGDLFDQESKLARSGLGELFLGVEILSEKNVETYSRIFQRRGINAGLRDGRQLAALRRRAGGVARRARRSHPGPGDLAA